LKILNIKLLGFERKARLFCDLILVFEHLLSVFQLGFERKARLFCDIIFSQFPAKHERSWDLSVRLGYFVTIYLVVINLIFLNNILLGFERKARLFCDHHYLMAFLKILDYFHQRSSWDLSVRLGYFVTNLTLFGHALKFIKLGFERKARLFCDLCVRLNIRNMILL